MPENDAQQPRLKNNRVRRPQSERTRHTRDLICKMTLDVISKHGYRNANTTMIAEKAGVSRGALTHHFPTKVALVQAAFGFVLDEWEKKRRAYKEETKNHDIESYVKFLWKNIFNQPQFLAILEFLLAARGDAQLNKVLTKALDRRDTSRWETWRLIFNQESITQKHEMLLVMTTCFLRGLSLQGAIEPKYEMEKEIINLWIEFLKLQGEVTADY